jgi:hypothetical protein
LQLRRSGGAKLLRRKRVGKQRRRRSVFARRTRMMAWRPAPVPLAS